MKALALIFISILSLGSFAGARIIDREEGTIKITGEPAQVMLETILKAPVKVEDGSYVLYIKTSGQDFNYWSRTYATGKISCRKDGSSCIVDGTEVKNSRDGWFAPETGYYRVFGLGTLEGLDEENYFNCQQVYANVACDFKMED